MLPNDYARCSGKHQPNTDGAWPFPKLADECAACRRREPVSEDAARIVMIAPPEECPCPDRIAQEGL